VTVPNSNRVPPAEVYSSISAMLLTAWLDKIERRGVEATPAFGIPEAGGVAALRASRTLADQLDFGRQSPTITIPDSR